jgi:hypothetical protein
MGEYVTVVFNDLSQAKRPSLPQAIANDSFPSPFDIYQLNERFIWCLLCTACTVYFMTFFLYSLYIDVFTIHPPTVQTFGHHCLDTELTFQRRRPVRGISSTPCQTIPYTTEFDLGIMVKPHDIMSLPNHAEPTA